MTDEDRVREAARDIADAIGRRDVEQLSLAMAPGFVHRSAGGEAAGREAFLRSITEIPGEIVSVELDQVTVDLSGGGALVTGVQRARLRIEGEIVDDRGVFVDWFVKVDGGWRIQVAVSLPVTAA
jgi:ketosteroid isomerase-like protein